MSALSDYLEDKWLRMLSGGAAFTPPATYVALFTVAPSDSGGGTEVSGGGYARQQVNQDGATQPYWNAPVDNGGPQLIDNNGEIAFPQATASWGDIVAVGIFDAATGGNLLYHGTLSSTKTISTNDTFKFPDGDLDLTLA